MKKSILVLLLVFSLLGCNKKAVPKVDEADTLYINLDETKLTQYVGDCLNYNIVKETNGILPPTNMMCELLEEPGEITITIKVTSVEYENISKEFPVTITILAKEDKPEDYEIPEDVPKNLIVGEQLYQCNNWQDKENRFRVGNPSDETHAPTSIIVKVTEELKIYLLTEKNASYWWQSDFVEEDPSIYRVLGFAQFRFGSYVSINNESYAGYFILESNKLYYISGEMIHDLTENLACEYISE